MHVGAAVRLYNVYCVLTVMLQRAEPLQMRQGPFSQHMKFCLLLSSVLRKKLMKQSSVLLTLMIRPLDGCKGSSGLKILSPSVKKLKIKLVSIGCGSVVKLSKATISTKRGKTEGWGRERRLILT